MKRVLLFTALLGLLVFMVACSALTNSQTSQEMTGPQPTKVTTEANNKTVILMEVGGDGEPIKLVNNPRATNPTYAQLLAFIARDRTDEYSYIFGPPKIAYVCSDFAEDVHNNAEAAGIKAAWVGIDIVGKTEGHALNAFQTTDISLVYVDCTGKGLWSESTSNRSNWDRRARVEVGKPYAVTDMDKAYRGDVIFKISIEDYLEETAKIAPGVEYKPRMLKVYEWVGKHDVRELGRGWMQDWLREHGAELCRNGRLMEPVEIGGSAHSDYTWSNSWVRYTSSQNWRVNVECLEIPAFQPQKREAVDVDGMPVAWEVSGVFSPGLTPLGVIKDIYIHW